MRIRQGSKKALVPICCDCGLIRDDSLPYDDMDMRKWHSPTPQEQEIIESEPGRLSHGYCPKCAEKWFSSFRERQKAKNQDSLLPKGSSIFRIR